MNHEYEQVGSFYFKKDKPPLQEKLICNSCGQNSGYVNSMLSYLKKGRELRCKKCGEICLKHI